MKLLTTSVLLIALCLGSSTASVTPCQVGKTAPAFGFWAWRANSSVKVFILSSDFAEAEFSYLLRPLQTWNAVVGATGTGVQFEYVGTVLQPQHCENCLTIMRGHVFDKTKKHMTELRAYSARADQIMTWAQIVIDPVLTNPKMLTDAVTHEVGHNFGLLDCYGCKAKSTVMNQFKTMNSPNEMDTPTPCDIQQVKASYAALARHVGPAPTKSEIVNEGEEPVDDDTPIVMKKPENRNNQDQKR